MKVGIKSFGAYIPLYRLSAATLAECWGKKAGNGEKAVANWDEDSLTMATEAITDCIDGLPRDLVDGLYYATTTPIYIEKQNASIISKVLNFKRTVINADFGNSLRGGTSALTAAVNAVKSGSTKNFVVASSDCRVPPPNTNYEAYFGDGAAALLVSDDNLIAEIEGSYSISSDFLDIWKRKSDTYIQSWEDRFVIEHGYLSHVEEVVTGLLSKYSLKPQDFNKVVMYAYDERRHNDIAKKLGFDIKSQVQDPLLRTVGNTGAASAMLMLVAALEEAQPDERILFVGYGDGADAFILKTTDEIAKSKQHRGVSKNLVSKSMINNYGKYINFRNLMEMEASREIPRMASLPMSWRDRGWILSFQGSRCKTCSGIQFPPQRICPWCQTMDNFEEYPLSDKKATLFTYGIDYLASTPDPPIVGVIIDFDGGGRFTTTMTDRDIDNIYTGMPVEMTFRLIHDSRGYRSYFWKCRPVRA